MEQFVLVPISVYKKVTLKKSTAVIKKELPIYQSAEKPTYHIESVKNFFAKADFLVDTDLYSPRIKLSTSNF